MCHFSQYRWSSPDTLVHITLAGDCYFHPLYRPSFLLSNLNTPGYINVITQQGNVQWKNSFIGDFTQEGAHFGSHKNQWREAVIRGHRVAAVSMGEALIGGHGIYGFSVAPDAVFTLLSSPAWRLQSIIAYNWPSEVMCRQQPRSPTVSQPCPSPLPRGFCPLFHILLLGIHRPGEAREHNGVPPKATWPHIS